MELSSDSKNILKKLVLKSNPNFAETAFLGLGEKNVIEAIVVGKADLVGVKPLGEFTLRTNVHLNSIKDLFAKTQLQYPCGNIILLGHLHPSGKFTRGDTQYNLKPDVSLLNPSLGYPLGDNSDLGFFREFARLNPTRSNILPAIVANTEIGPQIRIFNLCQLIKIRKYSDFDRVSHQTIQL